MNVRCSRGDASVDVLHIAVTGVLVLFIFASVGFGASLRGRKFRFYSWATLLIMVVFSALTSLAMRGIDRGEPTPWVGVTERIDIDAFLLWVEVLAISLLRIQKAADVGARDGPRPRHSAVGSTALSAYRRAMASNLAKDQELLEAVTVARCPTRSGPVLIRRATASVAAPRERDSGSPA
jgi:hypothetical protein